MSITNQEQNNSGHIVAMFLPEEMEQPMVNKAKTPNIDVEELSIFDIKDLYDRAYAEKAKGEDGEEAFKELLEQAVKLDLAYRRELTKNAVYKDKSKVKNFKKASASA